METNDTNNVSNVATSTSMNAESQNTPSQSTPSSERPPRGNYRTISSGQNTRQGFTPRNKDNRGSKFGVNKGRGRASDKPSRERRPRPNQDNEIELATQLIEVKRVTRVVKGGKRMRFAALVVVGDKKGKVGMGFMKGMDFQDAVAKATTKAKSNLIDVKITDDASSIKYPITFKYKSASFLMKPATQGTGLIAGGYMRPVLELVGIKNIYTKVLGSNNKIAGVQAVIKALQKLK